MLNFQDRNLNTGIFKKAAASILAMASCLYFSAGLVQYGPVLADEVPSVTEEEVKEETDAPAKKTDPENDKAPDEKNDGSDKPKEAEPEKESEPEPGTPAETEDKPEASEPDGDDKEDDSGKPSETESSDPEERKESNPEETTSETTPGDDGENPSEKPSEDQFSVNTDKPSGAQPEDPSEPPAEEPAEELKYKLSGKVYIKKSKIKSGSFRDGVLTLGKIGKRLESFSIKLTNETGYQGSITYRAYVRKKGWSKWVESGKTVGTKKKNLRIEAVQIKLTGELAKHYLVEYKAAVSSLSDKQGWVTSGAIAGTRNNSKRIEEIQVRLVPIGKNTTSSVIYRLRGQTYGWQSYWSKDGQASGTFSKRMEAVSISLGPSRYPGGIAYRSFIQGDKKWTGWSSDGSINGKSKTGKRIEALQIKLTGIMANHYDVYYRVYVQSLGWLDWAKNGQTSGSTGMFRRIEKIQIVLREKDSGEPGDEGGIVSAKPHSYYFASNTNAIMTYKNILDAGYVNPDTFRKKLISNFEYMDGVGYFHMGKMVQGYTDCAGSVSLAFRVALGTAKFTGKYKKGTLSNGKQLYGIGINYCGIKSYKDKYGWCRNGTASVNSHFLNTIIKKRKISYSHVSLSDRSDGEHGWSNDEWIDYLKEVGAKPGDVFVWFNHDWSKKKGQHMTMYAGIGEDGIAYEWTASSTYGVILSPLTDRTPQGIFESFALFKGVADIIGRN